MFYLLMCVVPKEPRKETGTGVKGSCGPPRWWGGVAGKQTQVIWRIIECWELLNHMFGPKCSESNHP